MLRTKASLLKDYREHYRADAELIEDPAALAPVRFASESRRLESVVRMVGADAGPALLDIGCGSGWLARQCSQHGARVTASDLAPRGVAGARSRFPDAASFIVADAYHMPMRSESFDAIILSEVLEHLEEVESALSEVRRLLRPGGRAVVTVPFRETIVNHLCIHCNHNTPANAHIHSFDKGLLKRLEASGLSVRATRLLNNKLLELIGFPHRSRHWPYWCWQGLDWLCNRLSGKAAFLLILTEKAG